MMNLTTSSNGSKESVQGVLLLGFIIIDFVFAAIIMMANSFLFITIYRDPCRCLRTPNVFLIANLSVADFFMGFVSFLRGIELTYRYHGWGELLIVNITQYFIGAVSILAAVSTLLAMSYDRYVAVIKPFEYPLKVTNTKAKIFIFAIWTSALVFSVLPVSDVRREKFLLAYCYSHFVIPSFLLTTIYVKIYRAISLQREELKNVRASLTAAGRRQQLERENRMVMAFIAILLIFYLSFLPYFINIQILYFCSCRTSYVYRVYHYVANEFLSVSSIVDPFMYAWRIPKFNRSLRMCFRRRNVISVLHTTSTLNQGKASTH